MNLGIATIGVVGILVSGCVSSPTPTEPRSSPPPVETVPPAQEPATPIVAENVSTNGVGTMRHHFEGNAKISSAAVCPPNVDWCAGWFEWTEEPLPIPANASALVVNGSWSPANPTANRLKMALVLGDGLVSAVDGESPLAIQIAGTVKDGEYRVAFQLTTPGGAVLDQEIRWTADFDVGSK